MVIGENFAWAHLGKTGGNSAAAMFCLVRDHFGFAWEIDEPSSNHKHTNFTRREVQDKPIKVLTLRRLPGWILSRIHHLCWVYALGFPSKKDLWNPNSSINRTLDSGHVIKSASICLYNYLQDGITHWFRTETLALDFLFFMENVLGLDLEPGLRNAIAKVWQNRREYERDHFWIQEEIEELYCLNPIWAEQEKLVYGFYPWNR